MTMFARKRESAPSQEATAHAVVPAANIMQPAQIAFLGEWESGVRDTPSDAGAVLVQILCWSCTPMAWQVLLQCWESMKAYRDEMQPKARMSPPVVRVPETWIHAAAPSLGRPFRATPAEESTLAALIARAQIAFAVSIVDRSPPRAGRQVSSPYRTSVPDCLTSYLAFLKSCGSEPCRLAIAADRDAIGRDGLRNAFKADRKRFQSPQCAEPLQLRFCPPGEEPLPLELANLACAAVVRHLHEPTQGNPIFEEVRSKLAKVPRRIANEATCKHR